jgi:uncharacterized protein involved in tolerance to divalent cations
MKTLPHFGKKVELDILAVHPYEIPAVIQWTVETNESYGEWVKSCVAEPEV